jgi:FMN-dependent NADH-azoreductase
MQNVLLVTSSPRGEASFSTQLATELAGALGGNRTVRELWREPLAPIGPDFIQALFTPEDHRTPEQRALLAPSDEAVAELQRADVIVVGAGMINFGMPAQLKTWIDLITRAGLTFSYDETGPKGLLTGKRLVLVLASKGVYTTGPMQAWDHLEPALRTNLGFLGLTDVEIVRIEGVGSSEEATAQALATATVRVREVVASVH